MELDIADNPPQAIIVMGVSGSGKSTLGAMLAKALGCAFLEGDEFHDAANVAKMRAGQPLDDNDRWPWLDRLGAAIGAAAVADGVVVAACSALKRAYRDRLIARTGVPTCFILPDVDRGELERRMGNRPDHYMPVSLLESQLDTLERPAADEPVLELDTKLPPERVRDEVLTWLNARH